MTDAPDVSIVLNVHREGKLLPRTLRAIEDTAIHAGLHGVTSELVIVLDDADDPTRHAVRDIDAYAFRRVVAREVFNRSLGPSRNDGVALAEGAFVITVDGDDLYSFNYLAQLHDAASRAIAPTIVYPEYSVCFGTENYLHRLLPLAQSGRHRLAGTHTFASCLMAPTALLRELRYRDCAGSSVYAYEDYDLNLRAVAAGIDITVGEDAVLFYRKHARSIMAGLHGATRFIAPPSDFFRPEIFCAGAHHAGSSDDPAGADRWMKAFRASARLAELVAHATTIEPEIEMATIAEAVVGTAEGFETAFGEVYHELCASLVGCRFTDVALVSSLSAVPEAMLSTLRALARHPDRHVLMIGDLAPDRLQLPAGSRIVDLARFGNKLSLSRIYELTLRLVQTGVPNADLHFAACGFVESFVRQFAEALRLHRMVLYDVESDGSLNAVAQSALTDGSWGFDLIVLDRQARIDSLLANLPRYAGRVFLAMGPEPGSPESERSGLLLAALDHLAPKITDDRWTKG